MTKEELKVKIDELAGLESEMILTDLYMAELHYFSSTGVALFVLVIYLDRLSGWRFGGFGGHALPGMWGMWKALNDLHRTP